jgi:regulator of protease activity HflC (stomatin/prohibitin superfamily)
MPEATVRNSGKSPKGFIIAGVILLIIVILAFSSVVIISSGTVGVVSVMGAVSDNAMQPGFHVKAPFFMSVTKINTQTQKIEVPSTAASRDLQTITIAVDVNYHVDPMGAAPLFKNVGMTYETKIISPAIQESLKSVTARFTAEELITQRQSVSAAIKDELAAKVGTYYIITDEFNITNLDFSSEFNAAIEAKQTAQQNALRAEQELSKVKIEAQQQVEQAKAKADATKATADAEAYATKARAEAEAFAIEIIQKQLSQSADSYLAYQRTEKWDGRLPLVQGESSPIIDTRAFTESQVTDTAG